MTDSDNEIKIPDESYKSTSGQQAYHKAAIEAVIALSNKFTDTNRRLDDLAKNILSAAELLKRSSEKIAESNEKYSRSLAWFTGALVFVGLLQVLALLIINKVVFYPANGP